MVNSDTKSLFLSSVPFYCTNAETSRHSIAPKLKDKSCSLRCRSKNLRSLVTAAIIMSLLHDNVPAGNGVSSWISLKVHGLTPSRSHLPVGEWSRQAHAQEECKVAQPVAKQFMKSWKAAHSLLPSAALEAECVCRAGSNIPILLYFRHLFATRYPLIQPLIFCTNTTHLLFCWLHHWKWAAGRLLRRSVSPERKSKFGHPTPCRGSRERAAWTAAHSPWERNLLNACLNNTDCKINNRKL